MDDTIESISDRLSASELVSDSDNSIKDGFTDSKIDVAFVKNTTVSSYSPWSTIWPSATASSYSSSTRCNLSLIPDSANPTSEVSPPWYSLISSSTSAAICSISDFISDGVELPIVISIASSISWSNSLAESVPSVASIDGCNVL